jgi:hypothetical protein
VSELVGASHVSEHAADGDFGLGHAGCSSCRPVRLSPCRQASVPRVMHVPRPDRGHGRTSAGGIGSGGVSPERYRSPAVSQMLWAS